MSKAIYLVLCLNFLVIIQLQLVHSAKPAKISKWKQCFWKSISSDVDDGKIYECSFQKQRFKTYLRVVYQGNMRVYSAASCNRWFFTFNGVECSIPIDTAVYSEQKWNIIRTATIEGYCPGIFKGPVKVALNVGACADYTLGDAYTGFKSVSRIIIEEVEPPQES